MMNSKITRRTIRLSAIAIALAGAFGANAAMREIDEVTYRLITPTSQVGFGLGYLFNENARFGQYTGINEPGTSVTLDADVIKRDDATGTWWIVKGHDLGRDSRDLRVEHTRQGDWSYYLEYAELVRHSQYVVNTGLSGIGTNNLTVNGTALRDVHPATRRQSVAVGYGKTLPAGWDVSIRFKNEEKEGTRLFGRGTPNTQQWLAEPIDHTMQQIDVILGFTGEKFQLQTGYYGSFFLNRNSALNIDDPSGDPTNSRDIASFSPIGLPPDNYSHQFYATGGYNFTPTTRGTFKVSRARQTQQDTFFDETAPTVTANNLDGQVDTTLMQAGVTARPSAALSLLANWRYMDRDDKTPVRQYFSSGGRTYTGENEPRSVKSNVAKAEATYRVGGGVSLIGGLDYETRDRNTSDVRVVGYREQTEERGYRLGLKRMMSETLNGGIVFEHSDRGGSDFELTTQADGSEGSNLLAPIHLANRVRNKVKLSADWTPTRNLILSGIVEFSEDRYGSRDLGPREGNAQMVSLDATYAINDFWKTSAWFLRNDIRIDQAAQSSSNQWGSHTSYQDRAYGLSLRGTVGKLQVGVEASEYFAGAKFQFFSADTDIESLPDVSNRTQRLQAFGKYQMRKDLAMRVDLVHERWKTNDWQWADYVYADGTTLSQDVDQDVVFVGVTAILSWR